MTADHEVIRELNYIHARIERIYESKWIQLGLLLGLIEPFKWRSK
jgi:hypothetical protein